MDILARAAEDAQPVPRETKEQLLDPFIEAATLTFGEMAGIEVTPLGVFRRAAPRTLGEVGAALRLSEINGTLVFDFPKTTAMAIAERALVTVKEVNDEALRYDCLGEVANVVAGQAKALLHGSPYHFTFSTPTVMPDGRPDAWPTPLRDCWVIVFGSELGNFALQLLLDR